MNISIYLLFVFVVKKEREKKRVTCYILHIDCSRLDTLSCASPRVLCASLCVLRVFAGYRRSKINVFILLGL